MLITLTCSLTLTIYYCLDTPFLATAACVVCSTVATILQLWRMLSQYSIINNIPATHAVAGKNESPERTCRGILRFESEVLRRTACNTWYDAYVEGHGSSKLGGRHGHRELHDIGFIAALAVRCMHREQQPRL